MLQHPLAYRLQGSLHAIAQLVERALAALLPFLLPAIQRAAAVVTPLEAARVQQQPHHREFIKQRAVKNLIQRDGHIGRLHQCGVVVHQPQAGAVAEQTPVGAVVGIEALLQAAVGRTAAAVLPELPMPLIQLVVAEAGEHQRHFP